MSPSLTGRAWSTAEWRKGVSRKRSLDPVEATPGGTPRKLRGVKTTRPGPGVHPGWTLHHADPPRVDARTPVLPRSRRACRTHAPGPRHDPEAAGWGSRLLRGHTRLLCPALGVCPLHLQLQSFLLHPHASSSADTARFSRTSQRANTPGARARCCPRRASCMKSCNPQDHAWGAEFAETGPPAWTAQPWGHTPSPTQALGAAAVDAFPGARTLDARLEL